MSSPDLVHALGELRLVEGVVRPRAGGRPVVSVLDDFSRHCFADTAALWDVVPTTNPVDLDCIGPDFLLVESAWNGNDGAWRYHVTSGSGPRPPLVALVDEARRRGIPTVFWNKEDPPHFDEFAPAAMLFDHIFTTEASLVDEYKRLAPHSEVDVMRFAAAPGIHRPERVDGYRRGDVCFAGQYFRHKFPERREQMDFLFAAAAEFDFTIYSRMLGQNEEYAFPHQYEKYVVGSLPYREMVEEYRRHKVFLNVNSVPNSRSMCARRVFELASSKTIVLSAATEAVRSVYSEDEVPMASNSGEALEVLRHLLSNDAEREQMAHRAWRRTAREHTYADRMDQIRQAIGLHVERPEENLVLVTQLGLPHEALDELAASLLVQEQVSGFRRSWAVADPQWQQARPSTVAALQDKGIDIVDGTEQADWVAAWNPDVSRGEHYLEDLTLMASRYVPGHVVAVDPTARSAGVEEQSIGSTNAATWLAPVGAAGAAELFEAARTGAEGSVPVDSYLVSGVEASAEGAVS